MTSRFVSRPGVIAALAAGVLIASLQVPLAQQPAQQTAPAAAAAPGRGGRGAVDPRVQQRTYLFTDKPLLQIEHEAEHGGDTGGDASDGCLNIGSLRK